MCRWCNVGCICRLMYMLIWVQVRCMYSRCIVGVVLGLRVGIGVVYCNVGCGIVLGYTE